MEITKIKKDAVIDAKIGSGMLKRLHDVLFFLSSKLTEEDGQKYADEVKKLSENPTVDPNNIQFSEPWMGPVLTISLLISELEKKAVEQGHTYSEAIEIPKEDDLSELLKQ